MLLRKHEHHGQIWFPEAINTPDTPPAPTNRRELGPPQCSGKLSEPQPGHGAGATAATRPSPESGAQEMPDDLGRDRGREANNTCEVCRQSGGALGCLRGHLRQPEAGLHGS